MECAALNALATLAFQSRYDIASAGTLLHQALQNRAMEADCLAQVATDRINLGRTQAGIDAAQEAYTIALQIENAWGQVNSLLPLAQGLLELGNYAGALESARQAAQLARSNHMFVLLSLVLPLPGMANRLHPQGVSFVPLCFSVWGFVLALVGACRSWSCRPIIAYTFSTLSV
jgi:hypothetical protein